MFVNTSGQSALTQRNKDHAIKITKLSELEPCLRNIQLVVDVTAEWCIECRIMDKILPTRRKV